MKYLPVNIEGIKLTWCSTINTIQWLASAYFWHYTSPYISSKFLWYCCHYTFKTLSTPDSSGP